jgi:hypothetical protein
MQVDLPHPLGPTRPTICPGRINKFTPLKTDTSGLVGYLNFTSEYSMLPAAFWITNEGTKH